MVGRPHDLSLAVRIASFARNRQPLAEPRRRAAARPIVDERMRVLMPEDPLQRRPVARRALRRQPDLAVKQPLRPVRRLRMLAECTARREHDRDLALRVRTQAATDLLASRLDRKITRLNSSHLVISYAVFCLK